MDKEYCLLICDAIISGKNLLTTQTMVFFIFTTIRTSTWIFKTHFKNTGQHFPQIYVFHITLHVCGICGQNQNLKDTQNTSEHATGMYVGYL